MTQAWIDEGARKTRVDGHYAVIVCGGGPAGFAAAVSAARAGATTLLIEAAGCLGGVWTAGQLSYVLDNAGKGGLMQELATRLQLGGGYLAEPHPAGDSGYDGSADFAYDAECMKLALEEMCGEADVDVLLYTRVCATVLDPAASADRPGITHVVTEGCGERTAYAATVFIDCTGNGDLGALAGAGYDRGHPEHGKTQPASLMAIISGVPSEQTSTLHPATKRALYDRIVEGGFDPSYKKPVLFRLPHPDLCAIMVNHRYGVASDSSRSLTEATRSARAEIHRVVRALAATSGWEQARVVLSAERLGIREGRRLHGRYRLTEQDLRSGTSFDDGICRVMLPVDIHALEAAEEKMDGKRGVSARPYEIPYRSLLSANLHNMLMAGRCISGDFITHASYRVTGNAVPIGEAAGLAAAWSTNERIDLEQIDGSKLKQAMINRGYQMVK